MQDKSSGSSSSQIGKLQYPVPARKRPSLPCLKGGATQWRRDSSPRRGDMPPAAAISPSRLTATAPFRQGGASDVSTKKIRFFQPFFHVASRRPLPALSSRGSEASRRIYAPISPEMSRRCVDLSTSFHFARDDRYGADPHTNGNLTMNQESSEQSMKISRGWWTNGVEYDIFYGNIVCPYEGGQEYGQTDRN